MTTLSTTASVATRPVTTALSASSYLLCVDVADTTDGPNGTMKRITPYSLTFMRQDAAKSNYFFGDGGNLTNNGGGNVGGGWRALLSAVYCTDVTAVGDQAAMSYVGTALNPIVGCAHFGKFSGQNNVSGTNQTGCGDSTFRNATGSGGSAFGYTCANGITTGQYGCFFGAGVASGANMGDYVSIYGYAACPTNAGYTTSCIFGAQAKSGGGGGQEEVGMGYQVLWYSSVGRNVAIGAYGGFQITTGSRNVFIGESCGSNGLQKVDATNTICLGALSYTTKNNQVVVGNSSIVETNLRGKTVINSSLGSPRAWLDVIGDNTATLMYVTGTSTGIRVNDGGSTLQFTITNADNSANMPLSITSTAFAINGVTPIVRQTHAAVATDLATAITRLNTLCTQLTNYGLHN